MGEKYIPPIICILPSFSYLTVSHKTNSIILLPFKNMNAYRIPSSNEYHNYNNGIRPLFLGPMIRNTEILR